MKSIMRKAQTFFFCFMIGIPATSVSSDCYRHLENFAIPKEFLTDIDFHPVGYLESYPVDLGATLSNEMTRRLACLFIAAADAVKKKYDQDYLISTDSGVFAILESHVPSVNEIKRGKVTFLGSISERLRDNGYECPE